MALAKKGKYYYIYFRKDGKIVWMSTGCTTKEEALTIERGFMLDLQKARNEEKKRRFLAPADVSKSKDAEETYALPPDQRIAHKRGTLALSEMIECALKKQPDISKSIQNAFRKFAKECGVKYADQVTPKLVQEYLEKNYSGEDKNNKSFNKNRGHLNRIFRLCLVDAGLNVSPVQSVVCRKVKQELVKHRGMMSYEEFDRAMENLTDLTDKFMLMSCRWTTQRLETCARFTYSMFDFEKKVFLIEPGKTKHFNKFVCVPLFPEYVQFLQEEIVPRIKKLDPEIPIVQHLGYYSTNGHFSRHINRILRNELKIDKTFQACRSTGITWMKENGIPYEVRTDITGHSVKETEDVYARAIESVSNVAKSIENV